MEERSLLTQPSAFPKPADRERAEIGIEEWRKTAAALPDAALRADALELAREPAGSALLAAVFGGSPFLGQCLLSDVGESCRLVRRGPEPTVRAALDEAARAAEAADLRALMAALRHAKRRVALAVALADIAGAWPLERVTRALSDFAEAALGAAVRYLLRDAAGKGRLRLRDEEDPARGSGFIVIAMGKLGARELNYSSDIDLIVLYDDERVRADDPSELQRTFVRLTRALVRAIEERTADGYVFRTDLRLRPDPGAMPIAVSTLAAETYYESAGQNWERAAFIKARPVAGDLEAGAAFLDRLRPFVWRKHLDFAAIQDIHSIKRQIHAHRGGGEIAVLGHDLKLGRGGIREIEFFAQTQQLIWGGRDPRLRTAGTVESLRALAETGRIAAETADELVESYRFLRRVEHRLQMVADQQTHTLPASPEGLGRFAVFLGYPDGDAFAAELTAHLRRVEAHYAHLFEEAPDLGASAGNLVFTGGEHDPGTLETLRRLGFAEPETVSDIVRGWHRGRYRATRSTRARELLTELMPALMEALAGTADPMAAVVKFDEFLARLPAGVQLFSLFYANPRLLELVAEIVGGAPLLAEALSRNPLALDAVLSGDFFEALPDAAALAAELAERLEQARDFEDVLDIARRWNNDRRFQVGVHILRNITDADAAGPVLADIASVAVRALLPHVEADFARRHGRVPGGAMAIIALGKLGGREMTITSDLDLIFVYDAPDEVEGSDGARPLAVSQYYARLSQRVINAITAPTGEGRLYEVDMRLRPSGAAGPVASSLDAFADYQRRSAWTWEHMALTRARVVAGDAGLADRIAEVVRDVLTAPRDAERLLRDVAEMRARMAREHGPGSPWIGKHYRGGLVDLEFIAQFLQLRHAHDHPAILDTNTAGAFAAAARVGVLAPALAEDLVGATRLWRRIQGLARLLGPESRRTEAPPSDGGGELDPPEGLRRAMARAIGAPDFEAVKARVLETAAHVRTVFADLIETPAQAALARAEMTPTAAAGEETADGA